MVSKENVIELVENAVHESPTDVWTICYTERTINGLFQFVIDNNISELTDDVYLRYLASVACF